MACICVDNQEIEKGLDGRLIKDRGSREGPSRGEAAKTEPMWHRCELEWSGARVYEGGGKDKFKMDKLDGGVHKPN